MAFAIFRHGWSEVWIRIGGMRVEHLLSDCGSFLSDFLFVSSVSEGGVDMVSLESEYSDPSTETERERLLLLVVLSVSGIDEQLVAMASFFRVIEFSGGETVLDWLALRFFDVVGKSLRHE
ncbi:unnamed protein product [Macrosiphum euphorbiae]|uniref:Uncharacterized protein n=1 Tax=Macrosiphum euphorbiae TaxID=13131 RepID=A0AAV0XHX4_9HEMI|nr:unnamed protein product [Macrosiphum euphorbiae]